MWVYLRFFEREDVDYRPLYEIGTVLMFLQFLLDEFFLTLGVQIPFYAYRNAFLTGLPFLTLGLFLREYQQHLILTFRLTEKKLFGMIAVALGVSVFEWYGIGTCDVYCGTVLTVIAMVLYAAVHPTVARSPLVEHWICRMGSISTVVYLTHLSVLDFYSAFIRWRIEAVLFDKEAWLGPIFVALISIIASACCIWAWDLVKRIFKKK